MSNEKKAQDLARSELTEFYQWMLLNEIKDLVFLRDVQGYFHMQIDKFYRERKK